MKVAIGYPPFDNPKGRAFLGQNRQFQWGNTPWTAYPMVPAYAATLLKNAGYDVYWLDGIWGMQTYAQWEEELLEIKPDLLMLETKTPVVKRHWKIISKLTFRQAQGDPERSRGVKTQNSPFDKLKVTPSEVEGSKLKIVLVGDHVTALPEESMENSQVDYVLTGGNYDFLLLNLCEHLTKGVELEPGIWHRESSKFKVQSSKFESTGHFILNHDLDSLPFIDRDLTKWKLYAHENSNYARTPGTYTMFGRDCWWGRCTFCSWTTLYPGANYRSMSPKRALDEVGHILDNYPVKEIMDDSGTFPVGDWLREFCQGMIERGYNKRVRISCNMRFNSGLSRDDYQLMGKAGFRFILYGLESANQKTLDRIDKNLRVEQIEPALRLAKEAGLNPHPTAMVGYPWEGKEDALRTLNFAKEMFKKGYADSLQATIVTPYPGTPLFAEAQAKGWLRTLDWDRYDMREPILKTEMSDEEIRGMIQRFFYETVFSPQFVARKLKEGLTNWGLFKYYLRFARKFFSKLMDFSKKQ